jgi:hypothetical protein
MPLRAQRLAVTNRLDDRIASATMTADVATGTTTSRSTIPSRAQHYRRADGCPTLRRQPVDPYYVLVSLIEEPPPVRAFRSLREVREEAVTG